MIQKFWKEYEKFKNTYIEMECEKFGHCEVNESKLMDLFKIYLAQKKRK